MRLRDFFDPAALNLALQGHSKEAILRELVALLKTDAESGEALVRQLLRRETLGSTGVGRGIAIPHCRSLIVGQLRLAYGYRAAGIEWDAIDGEPVHHFFLIVAPPVEVSNLYLPVLGRIAQFAKEPDVPERLAAVKSPEEFFALLDQKGV